MFLVELNMKVFCGSKFACIIDITRCQILDNKPCQKNKKVLKKLHLTQLFFAVGYW